MPTAHPMTLTAPSIIILMQSSQTRAKPEISQIIRSNRRSFSLEVKPDGRLIVRAPKYATKAQIEKIVDQKGAWIQKTQARLIRQFALIKPKTFSPGDQFWYLGNQYPLLLTDHQRPLLELDGAFLLSRSAQDRAKETFIDWYRKETRAITQNLVDKYTLEYGFTINHLRITSARTRWGSCSSKGNLNFTYRLSMAPLEVIDYVVVHELAHLKHLNHSKAFWSTVAAIKPDYQKSRDWLKKYGALLTLD